MGNNNRAKDVDGRRCTVKQEPDPASPRRSRGRSQQRRRDSQLRNELEMIDLENTKVARSPRSRRTTLRSSEPAIRSARSQRTALKRSPEPAVRSSRSHRTALRSTDPAERSPRSRRSTFRSSDPGPERTALRSSAGLERSGRSQKTAFRSSPGPERSGPERSCRSQRTAFRSSDGPERSGRSQRTCSTAKRRGSLNASQQTHATAKRRGSLSASQQTHMTGTSARIRKLAQQRGPCPVKPYSTEHFYRNVRSQSSPHRKLGSKPSHKNTEDGIFWEREVKQQQQSCNKGEEEDDENKKLPPGFMSRAGLVKSKIKKKISKIKSNKTRMAE